jgi:uncharacterized protein YjbJ (UPF0337 family)
MGIDDKARHATQDAEGKVKEGWGKLTDDERLENEGRMDQTKASVGKAADKVSDAVRNVVKPHTNDR